MKLKKLANKEWKEVAALGPGVHMFRGKKTLFYNGEKLWEEGDHYYTGEYFIYDKEERDYWEVIIILPGVEVIPENTFRDCWNIKTVIMADTVRRMEISAFFDCYNLEFIRLSRNLEYIGDEAFYNCCELLTSIFIPPSCREIGDCVFESCEKLVILSVPQTTMLGEEVIAGTALIRASHFEEDESQDGSYGNNEEVNAWIKNINDDEEYALHRACSSFNPITDIIYEIVKRQGLKSFATKNEIGVTPVQYLEENPFADIDQKMLAKRYILDLMGETV